MMVVGLVNQAFPDVLTIVLLLQVGLGLLIAALAMVGYRTNRSRPMLYLATGVALLTFVQFGVSLIASQFAPGRVIAFSTQTTELIGLVLILYSIVVARRQ